MILQRRNFLIGLASSLGAPAIVRAENIMPVRALAPLPLPLPLPLPRPAGLFCFYGSGTPVALAPKGSLFLSPDRLYINTDGHAAWTAVKIVEEV